MATGSLKTQLCSDDRMSLIKTAVKKLDSDVEIVSSEGDILLANSFLLSLASPFLQSLLLPLLPTDNQTSARIHLPDVSKRSLSHLINILKQGFSTGPGTGSSIREEVQEAARALGFTELPVLSMSSNNEYFEDAGDEYEKMIKSEWYCILCQMYGHTFSEACVDNARCHSCGVKGHVRKDCKEQKPDFKHKIKREVKREYGDLKQEKYDVKDIKLEVKKEKIAEFTCEINNTLAINEVEAERLPLAHQEPQQPSNSNSPRGNKAGPAETKRKLPKRKRQISHGSYLENSDDCSKVKNGKKKRSKSDDKQYWCTKCDYKSRYKGHVKEHQESVHDKVKYPCSECEYKATTNSSLNKHIKSVHERIKYPCSQCDYEATHKSSLSSHIKSIHEGVKYQCSECEYEATQKSHLTRHVKRKH